LFTIYSFLLYCAPPHRSLHSFPTRRSSDLLRGGDGAPRELRHRRVALVELPLQDQRVRRPRADRGANVPQRARPDLAVVVHLARSEEHTSELQSQSNLVCRLLLEKKKKTQT